MERPADLSPEEEAVYELCADLHSGPEPAVSDAVYAKAKAALGA